MTNAADTFEKIMLAELSTMATYFVSEKGVYNTNKLIESADEMFPEEIRRVLTENDQAIRDIRAAGKCLVFDLGTAAGFHIARAVESVVLQYLEVLCPEVLHDPEAKFTRNLNGYITLAKNHGGDKTLCAALDQFRDLHRNPLIHPEAHIEVNEAMRLLGIASSTISEVILDIKSRETVE